MQTVGWSVLLRYKCGISLCICLYCSPDLVFSMVIVVLGLFGTEESETLPSIRLSLMLLRMFVLSCIETAHQSRDLCQGFTAG
jgi:hypothetical protein